ncbi:MAG: hypothetical protein PHY88_03000 [Candidatus Omnitrophica bacterium]|nr:hypothetical protein [Candidatus Omnitrophota bacterium]
MADESKMPMNGVETAKSRLTIGIALCVILIIAYSFLSLPGSFDSYYVRFRPSPKSLIFIRYLFSLGIRAALFISGIGILFRKDIFRKIAIFVGLFTIATIYWKHPVEVYRKILWWQIRQGVLSVEAIPRIDMLAWFCAVTSYLVDIIVSLCLVYYLTRPKVRKLFD